MIKKIKHIGLLFIMLLPLQLLKASPENIFAHKQNRDTLEIVEYLTIAKQFYNSDTPNYDSAIVYLNKALDLALSQPNGFYTYTIYDTFADILRKNQNNSLAIDYYFKMLQMLDEKRKDEATPDLLFQYSLLYRYIGACMSLSDKEKALDYCLKSLEEIESLNGLDPAYPGLHEARLYIYNNIEAASIDAEDYETAAKYCDMVLNYPVKIDNPIYYAALYNNLGVVNWELGNYEEAFDYYNKALEIREEIGDLWGMATIHFNLGKCYLLQEDYEKAEQKFALAMDISDQTSNVGIEMYASEGLANLYISRGDYKQAAEMLQLTNLLKDSIAGIEKITDIARIEVQYLLEKQLQESELKQQILVSEKERKALIVVFVAIALFFLVLIFLLLYNNQRIKNRKNIVEQESLAIQNENLELKNQQLRQTLDNKTKELNTHMSYLLKRNEYVTSIIENVSDIKKEEKGNIQSAIKDIKGNLETSVWNEFSMLFQDLHQDFYQELYKVHPNLSPNEKKLCAFIRLNMSTKDISAITLQSPPTIEIARSRLRKKLNLQRGDNLTQYLSKF
jgi:Tfp pilus assembly protein PilF